MSSTEPAVAAALGRAIIDGHMQAETSALLGNPFAALTAVVGPAILTNACSVLALNTSNRLARVVDRTRIVVAELAGCEPGTPAFEARQRQRERLHLRAELLLRALRNFYAALGFFASAAILLVVGSVLAFYGRETSFTVVAAVALGAGGFGVAALVAGSVQIVRETRFAVENLAEEARAAGCKG